MNKTIIGLLIDKTGSMDKIYEKTVSAIDEYIKTLMGTIGEETLILATFNSFDGMTVVKRGMVKNIGGFSHEDYIVGGATPLYDAMMQFSKVIGDERVTLESAGHKVNVIFVTMTDGEENASTEYKFQDVVDMVKERRDAGWEIVFLGADIDAFDIGGAVGISRGSTQSFAGQAIAQTGKGLAAATLNTVAGMREGTYTTGGFFSDTDDDE